MASDANSFRRAATAKQLLDDWEESAQSSTKRALQAGLEKRLSLRQLLGLKLVLASVLYTAALFFICWLQILVTADPKAFEQMLLSEDLSNDTELIIVLKACFLDIGLTQGSGIKLTDTTFQSVSGSNIMITTDSSGHQELSCTGPAQTNGEEATATLEIGRDARWKSTHVDFQPGGRSMLRATDYVDFGKELQIHGNEGIVQLGKGKIQHISGNLDSGYIYLYETDFENAELVLGGITDVYMWLKPGQKGVQVNLKTGKEPTMNISGQGGLCLSDVTSTPSVQTSAIDGFDFTFSLGDGPHRSLNVTRANSDSRLYLTYGVSRHERNCNNTLHSLPEDDGKELQLESRFQEWIRQVSESGTELIRLWLLGPSLGATIQSMDAGGSWVYSVYGDALMWFPPSMFKMFTLGIFSPRTARTVALVKNNLCLAGPDRLTAGTSQCKPSSRTSQFLRTQTLEICAGAIKSSLPPTLNRSNAKNSVTYYVTDNPYVLETGAAFPALADGKIDLISAEGSAYIKQVQGRATLHNGMSHFFIIVLYFLPFAGSMFIVVIVMSIYTVDKERYLRVKLLSLVSVQAPAEGWISPETPAPLSARLGQMLEMEARSNLLLTILHCLITRSPAGSRASTIKQAFQVVLGQFAVMQLLVAPFCVMGYLMQSHAPEVRALCAFGDWVEGRCLHHRSYLVVVVINIGMLVELALLSSTIIEYLARHKQDVMVSTPSSQQHDGQWILALRSSKFYSTALGGIHCVALFVASGFVILVDLFILLGMLLQPTRLAPILVSMTGAVVVVQQVTVQFKEFTERAKAMAANILKEAEETMGKVAQGAESVASGLEATADRLASAAVSPKLQLASDVVTSAKEQAHGVAEPIAKMMKIEELEGILGKAGESLEEIEESLLMILGLSKGQLLLLNIQAVLLFLAFAAFLLVGAYIFLGPDALVPQLTANVGALAGAIGIIRARANSFQERDIGAITRTMQAAADQLSAKQKENEGKKIQ